MGRVIIPRVLRVKVLKELHKSHQHLEKSLRLARDLVFWPGMASQIKDLIASCDRTTCNAFQKQQPKEPFIPYDIPELPWTKVGADLFEWNDKSYLIIVDYYSKYFEFNLLENTYNTPNYSKTLRQVSLH